MRELIGFLGFLAGALVAVPFDHWTRGGHASVDAWSFGVGLVFTFAAWRVAAR